MSIQETIARFNSLHKAERDALDTLGLDPSTIDTYLKTAGESNRFFAENWPLVSAELKRLQSALDLANAGFEGCDNLCAQHRATIEKAREALDQLARLGAGDRYGNSDGNRIAQKALAALDEPESDAGDAGDGWISVKDGLPPNDTSVLILLNGDVRIGELRWERPTWEETFSAFQYWDDPLDEGQDWAWEEVTHWRPLPAPPRKVSDA